MAHYSEATNALARTCVDRDELRTFATAILSPRSLYEPGSLADQRTYDAGFPSG
ncbi:hypothetical protein J7E97_09990 [Streptomyces sp. ISL-66]|uniref:hypothetical protein n=1 Tax=Streptomyces sp. ISL-66 TaxID=2819186 RepID=UPI001BE70D39|nr:hypothetical protein [Streptomyces sp. ISL-66]MBT2468197.1 hypothetical protein [Streptomyces sp. ISL-66]